MGLQRFPLADFRGGVNTVDNPADLMPDEAQDLMNVTLTRRGVLSQRSGKTRFDSSGFPAAKRAEHMRGWNFGSTKLLMCSIDGTVYSASTGGALTSRFAGTAGKIWCFESMTTSGGADQAWMMNGTDAPQKWDGAAAATSAWANTPPNGTMCRVWRNRMVIAGVAATPSRLFFSDIGNPESPAASYGTNWVDVRTAEDDFDPIAWLELIGDQLIVFKRRSVWVVYDPTNFSMRRLGGPGCEDRFQSCESSGRVYYFNRSGLWSVSGAGPPNYESRNIENWIQNNINYAALGKARLISGRDRRVFMALPIGASGFNNRLVELVPDMLRTRRGEFTGGRTWAGPSFVFHDYPCESLAIFRPVNTDVIMAGNSANIGIHQLFNGTNDDGAAIAGSWTSRQMAVQDMEPVERLRRFNARLSGQCFVDVLVDDSTVPKFVGQLISPTDPDAVWDGGVWDGGVWDPLVSTSLRRVRPETRGRYHTIRFRNSDLNKTFTIFQGELAIRGGKEQTE